MIQFKALMKLADFEEDVEPIDEFYNKYPDRPAMLEELDKFRKKLD
jgi:FMN phosphatase YigB (HAD superfamily)